MASVGETLRRERLRSGLDLEKIAQVTKISVRMLEYMEADRFDKLPGGVFARSFVRQYARAVGLDADELVRELERVRAPGWEPQARTEEAPQPEIRVPRLARWGGGRRLRTNSALPALLLAVMVMLACSVAYTWWQKSRRNPAGLPAAVPASAAKTPAVPAPAPLPANPEPPAQPVAAAARPEDGSVRLALTAEEPTWVQAKANGKVVFSGIIQPNETKSLEAADTITLRIGNAGGLAISLNGKAIPAVGPKGQVRVVQVSRDGAVQVESLPKPQPQTAATETL
jgi:cytoskeleton protein RodZ